MRFRRLTCLAILAATAASLVWLAPGGRAQAAFCPQYVAQYCVKEKDGFVHTAWTNPCFAKERGAKILYRGACKGK